MEQPYSEEELLQMKYDLIEEVKKELLEEIKVRLANIEPPNRDFDVNGTKYGLLIASDVIKEYTKVFRRNKPIGRVIFIDHTEPIKFVEGDEEI